MFGWWPSWSTPSSDRVDPDGYPTDPRPGDRLLRRGEWFEWDGTDWLPLADPDNRVRP